MYFCYRLSEGSEIESDESISAERANSFSTILCKSESERFFAHAGATGFTCIIVSRISAMFASDRGALKDDGCGRDGGGSGSMWLPGPKSAQLSASVTSA